MTNKLVLAKLQQPKAPINSSCVVSPEPAIHQIWHPGFCQICIQQFLNSQLHTFIRLLEQRDNKDKGQDTTLYHIHLEGFHKLSTAVHLYHCMLDQDKSKAALPCKASFHHAFIERIIANMLLWDKMLSSLPVIPFAITIPSNNLSTESKSILTSESNDLGKRLFRSHDSMNSSTLHQYCSIGGNWFHSYCWNITWMNIFCYCIVLSKTS